MGTPQENQDKVDLLKEAVWAHPMCFHFTEEDGYFKVYYPDGNFPNGARAAVSIGKALALSRLLVVMERHWKENGIQ